MTPLFWHEFDTYVGRVLLVGNGRSLLRLNFQSGSRPLALDPRWQHALEPFERACAQIRDYFDGHRRGFRLRLAPQGTSLQKRLWAELLEVPFGETITYRELAARIGDPHEARVTAISNEANPMPIFIPCHRVLGSDGSLIGYGGGLHIKQALLAFERGAVRSDLYAKPAPRMASLQIGA